MAEEAQVFSPSFLPIADEIYHSCRFKISSCTFADVKRDFAFILKSTRDMMQTCQCDTGKSRNCSFDMS